MLQIAAYGKGFVQASQDTWELFKKRRMQAIVDSDITSAICFLTGVCSGSICVIVVAAWTFTVYPGFTATISLLVFFIGYLMVGCSISLKLNLTDLFYLIVYQFIQIMSSTRVFLIYQARIAMALPHACVSCYYVCFAENPNNRLFDKTIPDRLHMIETGRDVVAPTPRVPRRFTP